MVNFKTGALVLALIGLTACSDGSEKVAPSQEVATWADGCLDFSEKAVNCEGTFLVLEEEVHVFLHYQFPKHPRVITEEMLKAMRSGDHLGRITKMIRPGEHRYSELAERYYSDE